MRPTIALLLISLVGIIGCAPHDPTVPPAIPRPTAVDAAKPAAAPVLPAPALARREPAVAGAFYPADPKKLGAAVEGFLAEAKPAEFKGRLFALIAPHAGYEFSGKTAAWSFRQIQKNAFKRVIVLGPSHYGQFHGFSILDAGAYATPLGDVPLDREICAKLSANDLHVRDDLAQAHEHSIEVELPFLQATVGDFKLVPILIGALDAGDAEKIAAALREFLTPSTLVVVSSDFTHYGRNYDYVPFTEDIEQNLRKLDMGAVDLILKKDFDHYWAYLDQPGPTICGRYAIAILLKMLPPEAQGQLLKYDTSGHVTGDFTMSVSYVSMMFAVPANWKPTQPCEGSYKPSQGSLLTPEEQKTLLKIARDTLEAFVRTGRAPEITAEKYALTPALKAECGAFVTLNLKNHELRGCIGHIGYADQPGALMPLYKTVAQMAVQACSEDPRFEPVRAGELKDIELEVSVLSLARKVRGPEDFEVGKHGIIIRKGGGGAVFLPQVAPEQHWSREQTLDHLCVKAGWPSDEWRKPGMTFLTFTAQVFGEGR